MNETTIEIVSKETHITEFNGFETFANHEKAKEYLMEWLDKFKYSQSTPITCEDGDYYDCGDYLVLVTTSDSHFPE
jgi:hypothetical protein